MPTELSLKGPLHRQLKAKPSDLNFHINPVLGTIEPIPGEVHLKAAVGTPEAVRVELKQALDSVTYGAVDQKGYKKGRLERAKDNIKIGHGVTVIGIATGTAAVCGIVAVPLAGFGSAVAIAGLAIAEAARLARDYTVQQHAALLKRIGNPLEPVQQVFQDTMDFVAADNTQLLTLPYSRIAGKPSHS